MKNFLRVFTLGFVFAMCATSIAAAAAAPDPVIGTWVLNLDKSKFHGDTAPKLMTRTYSAGTAGTDMKVTGLDHAGTGISQTATLTYDGKDCPTVGNPLYDTLNLTRANGSTVKSELKKDGKVVGYTTRSLSAKGKVLTLSTALKTPTGGTTHDVAVFDRQ